MFDPLMVNPHLTPEREECDASLDNFGKENDAPCDPLSLGQHFNRTYHVKSIQKPATPIDFGDASVDEDDEPAFAGPSAVATEAHLDSGDALLLIPLPVDPHEESDAENTSSLSFDGPFVTPQNRRILGDIDVDALEPPKPPTKQGTLKISFLTTVNTASSPTEASTTNVTSSDLGPDSATSGPTITLYPPTFDSIPPTSPAPQISDKFAPSSPSPRTAATFTPRRTPFPPNTPPIGFPRISSLRFSSNSKTVTTVSTWSTTRFSSWRAVKSFHFWRLGCGRDCRRYWCGRHAQVFYLAGQGGGRGETNL